MPKNTTMNHKINKGVNVMLCPPANISATQHMYPQRQHYQQMVTHLVFFFFFHCLFHKNKTHIRLTNLIKYIESRVD